MISKKIEKALNNQILLEAESSQFYLAMASWAEGQGLNGTSEFFYRQSDEERQHMLKLVRYVNERGGCAYIPATSKPKDDYKDIIHVFQEFLKHEINVTKRINDLVGICLDERDFTTQNFMQWYVSEQIEEEATARGILDKLNLIGNDKGGLYLFDRDIASLVGQSVASPNAGV
ncbi:MAG: ferritin [Glaciecola sp.]|jgi:ferritin